MKIVNRRGSYQQPSATRQKKTEGTKRTSPSTPKEKKGREKKDRRGFLRKPSFARAGAHVGAALDVDLAMAVGAFNGSAEDRRIWASIAWRVGVEAFHFALIEKLAEDSADGPARKPAAAFQAFLNARFPKAEGGAA